MTPERADDFDHSQVLKRVATQVLKPIGLVQRGRSRTWLADHGWWVIQTEFGPSAFGRGSYLMVGTALLWCPFPAIPFELDIKDRWSTPSNPSGRVEYIEAREQDAWERDVDALAQGAAEHVAWIRERSRGVADVRARLETEPDRFWTRYHLGVAAGVGGDVGASRAALGAVVDEADEAGIDWMAAPRATAVQLLSVVGERAAFDGLVASVVAARRRQVKLPSIDQSEIVRALTAA